MTIRIQENEGELEGRIVTLRDFSDTAPELASGLNLLGFYGVLDLGYISKQIHDQNVRMAT